MDTSNYWTTDTDNAIFEYIELLNSDSKSAEYERNKIFEKRIHKPLNTLIESLVNKFRLSQSSGTELSMDWLKSECHLKFLEVLAKGYINKDKGRPFTYLTSVLRFHMIAIRKQNQKQKIQLESHYYENEEYIFNESEEDQLIYDEYEFDEVDIDFGQVYYEKIIEYLKEDIRNNIFSSSKEQIFAEQLLEIMENLPKLAFNNKFFIKLMLSELASSAGIEMKRFTINYYLLKFWKRYQEKLIEEYH